MAAATLLHPLLLVCAVAAAFQRRPGRLYRLPTFCVALSPSEAHENIRTIYDAVVDVRMSAEHRLEGRIVDSINVPAQLWEHGMYLPRDAFVPDVLEQFETDCRLLCVCGDGRRSELAAQQLEQEGFAVDYIDGGLDAWAEQSLELEVEDDGGLVGSYV